MRTPVCDSADTTVYAFMTAVMPCNNEYRLQLYYFSNNIARRDCHVTMKKYGRAMAIHVYFGQVATFTFQQEIGLHAIRAMCTTVG